MLFINLIILIVCCTFPFSYILHVVHQFWKELSYYSYMVTLILNIIFGNKWFYSLTFTSHKIFYFAVKTHRYVNSFNFYEILYLSGSEKSLVYFQCRNFYCSWIIFCRNMSCLSKLSVIRGALLLIAKSERRHC